MKKSVLLVVFFLPFMLLAQADVVVAPSTDAILIEEASQSKLQFVERIGVAMEQSKLLLEAKEKIENVSEVVRSSVQVKRLIEHQKECFELIQWVVDDIDENDYANVIVENSASEIIDLTLELEDNITTSTKILSSSVFNMQDSERLEFIRDLNKEVTGIENKLYRLKRKNKRYSDLYNYYDELAKKEENR